MCQATDQNRADTKEKYDHLSQRLDRMNRSIARIAIQPIQRQRQEAKILIISNTRMPLEDKSQHQELQP